MRYAVSLSPSPGSTNAVDDLVDQARRAAASGVAGVWLGQVYDVDALSALAGIARDVPGIELGTSIVPIWARHPLVLAGQAQTVQAASHGRLALGLGLSHPGSAARFGVRYERPVRYLREYLTVLGELLRDGRVDFTGDLVTASTGGFSARVAGAGVPPVIVAALGPQMLRAAGELADGTVTWMVGPRTFAEHVVTRIRRAAREAGRPEPRVVAGVPVCVTSDVDGARERASAGLGFFAGLPSYRAMLDQEGASPFDLAVIGDEATVAAELTRWRERGATDVLVNTSFSRPEERERTWRLVGSLN